LIVVDKESNKFVSEDAWKLHQLLYFLGLSSISTNDDSMKSIFQDYYVSGTPSCDKDVFASEHSSIWPMNINHMMRNAEFEEFVKFQTPIAPLSPALVAYFNRVLGEFSHKQGEFQVLICFPPSSMDDISTFRIRSHTVGVDSSVLDSCVFRCIDEIAKNDELASIERERAKESSAGSVSKRRKCDGDDSSTDSPSPSYVCTGCDAFLTVEPDMADAMALVHSRIRRIVYVRPDPVRGVLHSVFSLHGVRALNHHYEVYRAVDERKEVDK
jgi:hypothetical protein